MIISIISVLFVLMMIFSIKRHTTFSLIKCIILGLTMSPFIVFSLAADLINKLSILGLKIGAIAGGENMESIMASYLTKEIKKGTILVRGDRSEDQPKDEDLH